MNALLRYADDFLSLFFPQLCAACSKHLLRNEDVICTSCIYHLPYTNFHNTPDNRVARQMWGRIPFNSAAAFLYFQKASLVQNLMHQLKYSNKPEVGFKLGAMYGHQLTEAQILETITAIVPVPLHPARQKKRGYNQSEHFARGLAESLQKPVILALIRKMATQTQTRKGRFTRYENMKDVFALDPRFELSNQHILLVDDVLTTGATIEACANELLTVPGLSLSIATIAFAD